MLNFAAIGILGTWAMIMISHLLFVRRTRTGALSRPSYRLPGSPVTEIVTLVFLAAVVVLMWFDYDGEGHQTVLAVPVIIAALVAGWFCARGRVASTASARTAEPVEE
ncbi:hypothetical protein GCM10009527_087510 [Actinomadura nitritigenes]